MRPKPALEHRAAGIAMVLVLALVGMGAAAQPAKPDYLSYAEFSADDTPQKVALKRAYNDAVQRYNQALYEYHVTLEQHDRLVDAHNSTTDPAERKKTREEAEALRAKLGGLRREATSRAATVDEAARRAAAGGVSLTR